MQRFNACGTDTSLGCSLGQNELTKAWAKLSTVLGLGSFWVSAVPQLSLTLSQGWLCSLIQPTRQQELELPQ